MEEEKNVRLSIVMSESDHKYLKMCCVKLGVSIKEFVLNATIERVDLQEDEWMRPVYKKRDEERKNNPNDFIDFDDVLKDFGIKREDLIVSY